MQQFSRVLSNYRVTFIGKKKQNKTKTKTNKLKRSILLGYRPQSVEVEMERLHSHGLSRGIVLNLRKIQLKALFKTTPKTSKNTQELC